MASGEVNQINYCRRLSPRPLKRAPKTGLAGGATGLARGGCTMGLEWLTPEKLELAAERLRFRRNEAEESTEDTREDYYCKAQSRLRETRGWRNWLKKR